MSSGNGRKNPGGAEVAGRGRGEVSRTQAEREPGGVPTGEMGDTEGEGASGPEAEARGMRAGWGRAKAWRGRGWQSKPWRRWVLDAFEVV